MALSIKAMVLIGLAVVIGIACIVNREALRQFWGRLRAFSNEVSFEMTKVAWPKMDEVIDSTVLIVVVTIALALMCLVVDSVFVTILKIFYTA